MTWNLHTLFSPQRVRLGTHSTILFLSSTDLWSPTRPSCDSSYHTFSRSTKSFRHTAFAAQCSPPAHVCLWFYTAMTLSMAHTASLATSPTGEAVRGCIKALPGCGSPDEIALPAVSFPCSAPGELQLMLYTHSSTTRTLKTRDRPYHGGTRTGGLMVLRLRN